MKKLLINTIGLVIMASLVFSCTNEKSLQQFIINQQEKAEIISFDLPASMLALQEDMQTPENLEILKSIKKANILAFQINDLNKDIYLLEKEQLKTILKQKKYGELMRFGKGNKGAKIYLVGDDDAIDELIINANDDALGWLLIRIIGKDMQPEKIMQLAKNIDFDSNDMDFSQLKDLLKNSEF